MKKISIILCSFACFFLPLQAQEDNTSTDEILFPEGMQENTDSLLRSWSMKNYLAMDSSLRKTNAQPATTPEEFADRLKRLPNVMEMTYNNIVQQYIDRYLNRLSYSVSYFLGASNFYIPIFEEALTYHQIPLELKYLPVIESAFNPKARSRAGAVGLWQFMPATAVRYGLEINSLVDERCDPIKSSYAAAQYLKDLYDIFGDWTLVIAAYNCGPNNINKAIHRSGGERDFWRIYPYLPNETRGYVPAFIAANYIMNYYGDHDIQPLRSLLPPTTDTIHLKKDVKMEQIVAVCGIELDEIKALNPQYTTTLIPGYRTTSTLRLPQEHLLKFIDLQDSIYAVAAQETSVKTSADMVIEEVTEATPVKKQSSRSKSSGRGKSIKVRKGQTLGAIAKANHTTVARLRSLNGIRGNNIRAGQKLRVK